MDFWLGFFSYLDYDSVTIFGELTGLLTVDRGKFSLGVQMFKKNSEYVIGETQRIAEAIIESTDQAASVAIYPEVLCGRTNWI